MDNKNENWLYTISPKRNIFHLNFKEIWQYRDLLFLFVKRDVVTVYKQTILGPLWYFVQPLITALMFTLIFNNIANIQVGSSVPAYLFNLAGITSWSYFSSCIKGTSNTFKKNQNIFGKVYFPRVIMPISTVISNLIKLGIQLLMFFVFYCYFVYFTNKANACTPQFELILLPILVLFMGLLGLGLGMIISSMTTKYRDLTFLVGFGVQLLMYASAVMYPLQLIQDKVAAGSIPKIVGKFIAFNPLSSIIEMFRYMTMGVGSFSGLKFAYTAIISIVVFLLGLVVFNKTEKIFIDTV